MGCASPILPETPCSSRNRTDPPSTMALFVWEHSPRYHRHCLSFSMHFARPPQSACPCRSCCWLENIWQSFAFIYMDDERDAEDAIRALDRSEFGRQGRRLRVEWTKDRGGRRSGGPRRSPGNSRPTKTLFVINFDPVDTRIRDLERHFEPYGKILNIRIRRNFAFIQFDSQEDATKALDATNMSKLMDRVISVEYALRDDDERRNGYSPDRRGRDRSPERRGHDRGRSGSPYGRGRERDSPDYGRGPSPRDKRDQRSSPDSERYRSHSPRTERS